MDFSKQNRLTQEIVRYLLTMDSLEGEVGRKIIYLLFGKMAGDKYAQDGVYVRMPAEKRYFRDFVVGHLRACDSQNDEKNSIFNHKKICEALRLEMAERSPSTHRRSQMTSRSASERIGGDSDAEPMRAENRSRRFVDWSRVPQGYLEHLHWLRTWGPSDGSAESFEQLLMNVFGSELADEGI